jgi:hypothetical protein
MGDLFGFIGRLRAEHGDDWEIAFPEDLVKLAWSGDAPWAMEILGGMARLIGEDDA